jgi:elongation factor Ts
MTNITASMVKELRERTGAGMMECKSALVEAKGDLAEAEIVIAKSGHKKAAKKAGRVAAEGMVAIKLSSNKDAVALVEINSETDFVARHPDFQAFSTFVAEWVLENKQEDIAANAPAIEEARQNLIAKLGENIVARRAKYYAAGKNIIGQYIHHGSKIGVIVEMTGGEEALAKDIAMHIAASKPEFISMDQVPEAEMAKMKDIFMAQAESSGKPVAIHEKIVQGQLNKHFAEICLMGQPFFKDPDKTIGVLLKEKQATIVQFTRFEVGEGIEVVKLNFHEEVMAQVQGSK